MTTEAHTVAFAVGMRVVVKDGIEADDINFGAGYYGIITGPVSTNDGLGWLVDIRGNAFGRPLPAYVPAFFYDNELEVVD